MTISTTHHDQQPVLVVMGVSGSGKSTVAGLLADHLGWNLQEGDDLHSTANRMKMASGQPLTDEDRWPWLDAIASWIRHHTDDGVPGIVTCSALKRTYRDRIRGPHVVFVYLAGDREQIGHRMSARTDHFMPTTLLDSQISTMEPPSADENAVIIDVGPPAGELVAKIIRQMQLVPLTR